MNKAIPIHLAERPSVPSQALEDLPLFPLVGVLLLPQTIASLHVFEPRYQRLMEDVSDGNRVMAIALLDEEGEPDVFGRPPIHPIAGLGVLRRSARLPDGRYNIIVEGLHRIDVSAEHSPSTRVPYRRCRAQILEDVPSEDPNELDHAVTALRALCARVVLQLGSGENEVLSRLNEITDPGILADMVAISTVSDNYDRRKILSELRVVERLKLAAGLLGALSLQSQGEANSGWGPGRGQA